MQPRQSMFIERAGDIIYHINEPEKYHDVDADELFSRKSQRK